MIMQEQFETEMKKLRVHYFKKYFLDKNINDAIYESAKDTILELTSTMTKVSLLIECLCILRKDEKFFSRLDYECKRRMKSSIIGFKIIKRELEGILKPISDGLMGK